MELEFPGVGVSITLKPGGFHESRTQDGCWTGEVGYSEAVPGTYAYGLPRSGREIMMVCLDNDKRMGITAA